MARSGLGVNTYNLLALPERIIQQRDVPERPVDDGGGIDLDAFREANPGAVIWSGKKDAPPAIGARVRVTINRFGMGTVESYFVEYSFLGVRVLLDEQPDWHAEQKPGEPWVLVFGLEIK